jgi:hypothetical protein
VVEEVVVQPAIPAQERQASLIERVSAGAQIQFASRRSLFTFDLGLNADYTNEKQDDQPEVDGRMAFTFVYKLARRTQFSANVSAAYLNQPDFSQINTPDRPTSGQSYYTLNSKFDLSYRWTPRLTSNLSLAFNTVSYVDPLAQTGNFVDTVGGLELRYLYTPRVTVTAETRYSQITYDQSAARDSRTAYLLLGGEVNVSRRIKTSLRLGASLRTFDESGKKSTAPYGEATVDYQVGRASVLRWTGRYGFEEAREAGSTALVLRTGLDYTQFFSPRLRGSLSGNILHRSTTFDDSDVTATEDTFDLTLGFEYTISRHWSLTGNYSFTTVFTDTGLSDYYRNRMFLGFEYEF